MKTANGERLDPMKQTHKEQNKKVTTKILIKLKPAICNQRIVVNDKKPMQHNTTEVVGLKVIIVGIWYELEQQTNNRKVLQGRYLNHQLLSVATYCWTHRLSGIQMAPLLIPPYPNLILQMF